MYTRHEAPVVVDRGKVIGRTVGLNSGSTVQARANFFADATNDGLDNLTVNGSSVDVFACSIRFTLDNPLTGGAKDETVVETD
jgi:hypothetical protein